MQANMSELAEFCCAANGAECLASGLTSNCWFFMRIHVCVVILHTSTLNLRVSPHRFTTAVNAQQSGQD